jgi:DNA-binding NtrC family response regulator
MNNIHLHIAFTSTSTDRQLSITGDCTITVGQGGNGMKEIKDLILKDIQKSYPEKEWNIPTIVCLAEMSEELYYRLFPEKRPKLTDRISVEAALLIHNGDRKAAAAQLGISPRTLYRKAKEYGLL